MFFSQDSYTVRSTSFVLAFPLAVVNMLQLIRLYIGARIYPEVAKVLKKR